MQFYCCLSPETTKVSAKTKKNWKKISLELVSGQTSVRSNRPLIRLVCAWNCLWSDRPRTKWPLIRQVPDHCPDKSALEAFSRPCNSSAPELETRLIRGHFGLATSTWVALHYLIDLSIRFHKLYIIFPSIEIRLRRLLNSNWWIRVYQDYL